MFSVNKVLLLVALAAMGCARVHHVQIGSIDNTLRGFPIEVVINDVGIDAAKVVRQIESIQQIGKKKKNNTVSNIVNLFQTGPKTGAPIYDEHWGEKLLLELHQKCPSAQLKNVHSQRLSTDYGDTGVTKEIVVVKAICIRNL